MGNSYTVLEGDTDLSLDEMSCVFDLTANSSDTNFTIAKNLTPEQVVDIAIKMIHAASYFVHNPQELMYDASDRARKYP